MSTRGFGQATWSPCIWCGLGAESVQDAESLSRKCVLKLVKHDLIHQGCPREWECRHPRVSVRADRDGPPRAHPLRGLRRQEVLQGRLLHLQRAPRHQVHHTLIAIQVRIQMIVQLGRLIQFVLLIRSTGVGSFRSTYGGTDYSFC